jgi:hypothetical protein
MQGLQRSVANLYVPPVGTQLIVDVVVSSPLKNERTRSGNLHLAYRLELSRTCTVRLWSLCCSHSAKCWPPSAHQPFEVAYVLGSGRQSATKPSWLVRLPVLQGQWHAACPGVVYVGNLPPDIKEKEVDDLFYKVCQG